MKEMLEGYIAACMQNIAGYMLMEDEDESQRAIDAAYGMIADFKKVMVNL